MLVLTIKQLFHKLGIFIEMNPIAIITLAVLFIILAFEGANLIEMASGTDTYVDKGSQLYQDYDHLYLGIFQSQSIVVMVENGNIKDPDVLQSIDRFETMARNTPGVVATSSISSQIKTYNYQMTGKYDIPEDKEEIDKIILLSNPEELMPDDTHTMIYVKMPGDASVEQMKDILQKIRESIQFADFPPDYKIIVTGDPAFNIELENEMNSSMGMLLGISVILMIIVLYLTFRHVRWRLLPLLIVLFGVTYTFGAMGYLNIPMTMVTMSAFPILIGLGIDYAIQFHNRIEEELNRGESAQEAVIETVKQIGPAVSIALVITALGFVSLFTSTVPMVRDFGKLLLIGISMCFLSSLFVGVTVIYSLDRLDNNKFISKLGTLKTLFFKRKIISYNTSQRKTGKIDYVLEKMTTLSIKHSLIILVVAGSLCMSGMYADQSVAINADTKSFVSADMPALIDWEHMAEVIGGNTMFLNVIVKMDDISDPETLKWIDEFASHEVATRDNIYEAHSIIPILKSMNGGTIPDTKEDIRELYAQIPEQQKEQYMYGDTMLLLNLGIGNAWNELGLEGMEELANIVKQDILWMQSPPGVTITITGDAILFTELIDALTSGRIRMTLLGLMLVFLGLLVIYRNWLKAFVPVITMFMVTGWSGGIMYFAGLEYNPMTATLGALIIGVGSEYAILMMERYYEEKEKGATPIEAMQETSVKIGKAILTSGLTTIFGFSALIASPFPINSSFGIITVLDVSLAILATFIVFPPVLIFLDTWREKRKAVIHQSYGGNGRAENIINKKEIGCL
jgi:hydrophobe/amphiphile efflux-3 (HAE3) family protein